MNAENPYAGQGAVLLDIGDDVGALVVIMPAALDGAEVEIRPCSDRHQLDGHERRPDAHHHHHDHHHHPHVAVVARPVAGGQVHSLVFPELGEGTYELYVRPSGPVELVVSVRGGSVTEAAWPRRG